MWSAGFHGGEIFFWRRGWRFHGWVSGIPSSYCRRPRIKYRKIFGIQLSGRWNIRGSRDIRRRHAFMSNVSAVIFAIQSAMYIATPKRKKRHYTLHRSCIHLSGAEPAAKLSFFFPRLSSGPRTNNRIYWLQQRRLGHKKVSRKYGSIGPTLHFHQPHRHSFATLSSRQWTGPKLPTVPAHTGPYWSKTRAESRSENSRGQWITHGPEIINPESILWLSSFSDSNRSHFSSPEFTLKFQPISLSNKAW